MVNLLVIIYLSFISLGLPDSLLGAAWPVMYPTFGVPVSGAGIIFILISVCVSVSSLCSDRMTRRFGAGRVNAASCAVTALALLGFSCSTAYWQLCLLAIPYGLGAGGVDAALNNYVAIHYASRHMSWLHCMWGVGAAAGPYIMRYALTRGGWEDGYRYVAVIQLALTAMLLLSLPMWKQTGGAAESGEPAPALPLRSVLRISGAKAVVVCFFCYCGLEQTVVLWGSSYLVLRGGLSAEEAAGFAALFLVGVTFGRGVSGFLTMRLSDTQMVRLGQGITAAGILCLLLPLGRVATLVGLVAAGLGCAPIYPCIIHATPTLFGEDHSQALIGIETASANAGCVLLPPLFGLAAQYVTPALFPWYLLALLAALAGSYEYLLRKANA